MRGAGSVGRRRVVVAVTAALGLVLGLTACEQVAVQAYDPPRKFGPGKDPGVYVSESEGAVRATLADKLLYTAADGALAAIDVTTGDTRWTTKSRWGNGSVGEANAPARIRAEGKWQIVAAFGGEVEGSGTAKGHQECDVVSVDAHTGKKLWQVTIKLPSLDEPPTPEFVGADARVAIVRYGSRAYAVDVRSHKVRWFRDNLWAQVLEKGVVVGLSRSSSTSSYLRLAGVDAVANQVRWRRGRHLLNPLVSSAGPGLIALVGSDYGSGDAVFELLRASGRTVTSSAYGAAYGRSRQPCSYDEKSVTVCSGRIDSDPVVFAVDVKRGKRLWTLRTSSKRQVPTVGGAYHGVVYASLADDGGGGTTTHMMLDARTGHDEKGDPGTAPTLVSRFGGVVGSETGGVTLHPATG